MTAADKARAVAKAYEVARAGLEVARLALEGLDVDLRALRESLPRRRRAPHPASADEALRDIRRLGARLSEDETASKRLARSLAPMSDELV